jgi:hypothetical protein
MQSVGAAESPHNVDYMPNSNGHTKHRQRGEVDIWVVAVMFLIPSSIVTPLFFSPHSFVLRQDRSKSLKDLDAELI